MRAVASLALFATLAVACSSPAAPPTPSPLPTQVPPTAIAVQPTQPAAPTVVVKKSPVDEVFVEGTGDVTASKRIVQKKVNIEFILDASGSMLDRIGGKSKLQIAKETLAQLLERLPANVNVGLRVYGHRYPEQDTANACKDIELLAPVGPVDQTGLVGLLQSIDAKGWTPIAKSIELAGTDMQPSEQNTNNVILISDGEETCGGDPVAAAKKAKQSEIDLTIHTISFAATDKTKEQLQQIAQYSGGTFHEADDSISLLQALEGAIATQKGTFLRVEVTGENDRQVSTSVVIRDPATGKNVHQFVTWLDAPVAPGTFDIIVGTAPRTVFSRRTLDKDTTIVVKVDTGALRVELTDSGGNRATAPVELQDPKTESPLRNFTSWYNQIALEGTYDLLINTTPPVTRRGVRVETGKLTIIPIGTGQMRIEMLGVGGNRIRTLVELRDPETNQAIRNVSTWEDYHVMAGTYDPVFENVLGAPREAIKIQRGESRVIKLNATLLRVEVTDKAGGKLSAPVVLLDAASQKPLGELKTGEDRQVLEGDYTLLVKAEPEIRKPVRLEPNKHTVVNLELLR